MGKWPKRVTKSEFVFMKLRDGAPREIYAGLLWIAKNKGYKDGWVRWSFKEIFGGWPAPQSEVEPEEPTTTLVEWLGKKSKRFSRLKKREEAKLSSASHSASAVSHGAEAHET